MGLDFVALVALMDLVGINLVSLVLETRVHGSHGSRFCSPGRVRDPALRLEAGAAESESMG